jgi:hypothetical protein
VSSGRSMLSAFLPSFRARARRIQRSGEAERRSCGRCTQGSARTCHCHTLSLAPVTLTPCRSHLSLSYPVARTCHSHLHSHSLSLPLSLFRSDPVSLKLSLSHPTLSLAPCHSHRVTSYTVTRTLSLAHCHTRTLSLSHSHILAYPDSHPVLSQHHSDSTTPSLSPSHSHTLPPSFTLTRSPVTLTQSHPHSHSLIH